MPSLEPVDFDPFAQAAPPPGPLQITVSRAAVEGAKAPEGAKYEPVDHDPFAQDGGMTAKGVGKAFASGVVNEGIPGLAATPETIVGFSDWALQALIRHAAPALAGILPDSMRDAKEFLLKAPGALDALNKIAEVEKPRSVHETMKRITSHIMDEYKPQNTTEEYAKTLGDFIPGSLAGGGGVVRNVVKYGVLPAFTSETTGQATKGTKLEPWARGAAAIVTGGAAGLVDRPGSATRSIRQQLPEGVTPQMVDQAEGLMRQAAQQGISLTWPEALSQVAGRPVLSNTMRHLEAAPQTEGRMAEFYGNRAPAVENAARGQFDNVSAANGQPSMIGHDASAVARNAIADSPEGRILADTVERAGPRMSPGDAGAVIQPELRQVYDRREGMRNALADQDYAAARNAPATIPTNGGYRETNAQVTYLDRQGIPILLDDAERAAAKAKWLDDNSYQTRIGIVGERPTQFAQVDAKSVVSALDDALKVAKGDPRAALEKARRALLSGGEVDSSVAGLHESRVAIDDLISAAKRDGQSGTVTKLMKARDDLDRALESVPAYGQAKRNFVAASKPLEPFAGDRAPGRIVERDQYNNRFEMSPEQVPGTIERGGGTAARDFNQIATPSAREAFEAHLTTQILENARAQGAEVSAVSIRKALRQNEDLLKEYPGVRDRLESVAVAREGLDRLSQLPIGKLAERDLTTKKAVDALFPKNPLPNSEHEIADAVGALASRNPKVASDLVRIHLESTFNSAAKDLPSGANQMGGAKFRAQLIGNSQQAKNVEAAVKALPNGEQKWAGFNRFLDILEATGTRQNVGSKTTYNTEFLKEQSAGRVAGDAVKIASNPAKLLQPLVERYERYKLGRNLNELAGILTDPASANLLRGIAKMPADSSAAQRAALRLITLPQPALNRKD